MLITQGYLDLQRDLHARYNYGRGVDAADCFIVLQRLAGAGATVLDYGCGQGHFARLATTAYRVDEYDPAIPGKCQPPTDPSDVVICADVLEHVEPELLDNVLEHIASVMSRYGVFVIATEPSSKIMADGRQAHICIMDQPEWRARISRHFTIVESRDRRANGRGLLYVVKPREQLEVDGVQWSEIGEIVTHMAVSGGERNEHTAANCARVRRRLLCDGSPVLMPVHDRTAILLCYGPSLRDTWQDAWRDASEDGGEVFTVSAAHRFAIDHGIAPYAHIECDPRPHKATQLGAPFAQTEYWLASCVSPAMLDHLDGHSISLWHAYNGPASVAFVQALEPQQRMIVGGGSVGLRALALLYYLGYRRFSVHGMDCSLADDGEQHAGEHHGKIMDEIPVLAGGRRFRTSGALLSYYHQFRKQAPLMAGADIQLRGDGLLQHAMRIPQ